MNNNLRRKKQRGNLRMPHLCIRSRFPLAGKCCVLPFQNFAISNRSGGTGGGLTPTIAGAPTVELWKTGKILQLEFRPRLPGQPLGLGAHWGDSKRYVVLPHPVPERLEGTGTVPRVPLHLQTVKTPKGEKGHGLFQEKRDVQYEKTLKISICILKTVSFISNQFIHLNA